MALSLQVFLGCLFVVTNATSVDIGQKREGECHEKAAEEDDDGPVWLIDE
jgi:hypothetical protein